MKKLFLFILLSIIPLAHAESPYTQPDKIAHYAAGASLAAGGTILFSGTDYGPEIGLSLAVAYGLGKEVYDSHYPCCHKVEKADAVATILGGLIVYTALKTQTLRLELSEGIPTISYRKAFK